MQIQMMLRGPGGGWGVFNILFFKATHTDPPRLFFPLFSKGWELLVRFEASACNLTFCLSKASRCWKQRLLFLLLKSAGSDLARTASVLHLPPS